MICTGLYVLVYKYRYVPMILNISQHSPEKNDVQADRKWTLIGRALRIDQSFFQLDFSHFSQQKW